MRTAIISDLHLGSRAGSELLTRPEIIERFCEAIEGIDRLVLLGDTVELRELPVTEAMAGARPFFERVGAALAGKQVVLVPGNHDHRLLGNWPERIREDEGQLGLDERVDTPHPQVASIAGWLGEAELEVRYPGIWVRDDVYATHGHYLDSHVTLPTIERLSIGTVDRLGGRPTGVRSTPEDYEQVQTPVYDLLFDLAQGGRNPQAHDDNASTPSMRIWELLGGASDRARNWRGKLLRSAVVPATLRGLERAGVGSFGRDFSLAEIGRSGVEAMHVVAERLEIEAEHVIFGHIHRRGPLPGEDGRGAADPEWERRGLQLHNTGSWVFVSEMLLGSQAASSPFWPGRVIFVGESGPPEPVEVLAEVSAAELRATAASGSPSTAD